MCHSLAIMLWSVYFIWKHDSNVASKMTITYLYPVLFYPISKFLSLHPWASVLKILFGSICVMLLNSSKELQMEINCSTNKQAQ